MSKAKLSIMKNIDHAILGQIEAMKDNKSVLKVMEKYNILDDREQKITNIAMMLFTLLFPLFIISLFFMFNSSKNAELELKESIITSASQMISKKKQMNAYTRNIFGNNLSNSASFKNKINVLLSSEGIDSSKVSITDFASTENSGVVESSALLVFKGLSDQNLYGLLKKLFVTDKFKVKDINITKNKISNLLDGNFDVSYYSKQSVQP